MRWLMKNFKEMLEYVKKALEDGNGLKSRNPHHQFRDRFMHTVRVLKWCKVIQDDLECDLDVLYTSAIFHDVGYSKSFENHNVVGAELFMEYAKKKNFDQDFSNKVHDIILHHSEKRRLRYPDSSNELIILLEADLLDEEGALGIAWDLMALGSMDDVTYYDTMDALKHSKHILEQDFMVTKKAREIWNKKKMLVKQFDDEIASDLFLEDEDGLF